MGSLGGSATGRGAAAFVLAAAVGIVGAGRLSVWFDLTTDGFGTNGFVAPAGAMSSVLDAACATVAVLAIATIAKPSEALRVVSGVAALALSVASLSEWRSEATVKARYPAGTLRATPVDALVSPSTSGWVVLASVVTLQLAAIVLLPHRRPVLIAVGALVIGTVAVGLLAPDQLTVGSDGVIR